MTLDAANRKSRLLLPPSERKARPSLTILVPVFNEDEALDLFLDAVDRVVKDVAVEAQYLFVNDGSQDETLARLSALHKARSDIGYLNFSKNFGKEAALSAGLDFVETDLVLIIDVDLQDPPGILPELLARWHDGYDNVYGVRANRDSDSYLKRATANAFYKLFNRFSKDPIPQNVGDFRLIDRRVVLALRNLPERSRFMKGIMSWVGFPSVGVPYTRDARAAGGSKFNYRKLWNFALDGIISFSAMPLKIWTYIGGLIAFLAGMYAIVLAARVLIFGVDVPGYASLMTAVLIMGSLNLISLGLFGEYMSRLFVESKRRPIYLIADFNPAKTAKPAQTDSHNEDATPS